MQQIQVQQLKAYGATWHEMMKKIGSSLEGVEKAADGMVDNLEKYASKMLYQFGKFNNELGPHIKEYFDAVPASAIHKLTLDFLRLSLKLTEDDCGKISLEYNPLHPGRKAPAARKRRDTEEKMTLAKFGKAISSLFTDVDNFVVDYISKSVSIKCPLAEAWFKEKIERIEAMDPEDFKKEIDNRYGPYLQRMN